MNTRQIRLVQIIKLAFAMNIALSCCSCTAFRAVGNYASTTSDKRSLETLATHAANAFDQATDKSIDSDTKDNDEAPVLKASVYRRLNVREDVFGEGRTDSQRPKTKVIKPQSTTPDLADENSVEESAASAPAPIVESSEHDTRALREKVASAESKGPITFVSDDSIVTRQHLSATDLKVEDDENSALASTANSSEEGSVAAGPQDEEDEGVSSLPVTVSVSDFEVDDEAEEMGYQDDDIPLSTEPSHEKPAQLSVRAEKQKKQKPGFSLSIVLPKFEASVAIGSLRSDDDADDSGEAVEVDAKGVGDDIETASHSVDEIELDGVLIDSPEETIPYITTENVCEPDGNLYGSDCIADALPCPAPPILPSHSSFKPDEFVCDGGDDASTVRVLKDWTLRGLDLEDTVGHFDTLDGRTIVEPSNKVCVYSPRFASVRKISGAFEDQQFVETGRLATPVDAIMASQTDNFVEYDQPLAAKRDVLITTASIFRDRIRGMSLENRLRVRELENAAEVAQDFQILEFGVFKQSQKARLAESIAAAEVWTDNAGPQVIIDQVEAIIDDMTQQPGIAYHTDDSGNPQLRIVKIASAPAAKPGEEIGFTLRFDNVGDRLIGNVTIIDNLTTRLEYVEDSAKCDVQADFFKEENDGDSLTLRWEIVEPLKPGEGGVIHFKCKLR